MFRIKCEDLMMLRLSNTNSSMLYNLLSVDEAQMFIFDGVLEKKQLNMSVPVNINMAVHFYTSTGTYVTIDPGSFLQVVSRLLTKKVSSSFCDFLHRNTIQVCRNQILIFVPSHTCQQDKHSLSVGWRNLVRVSLIFTILVSFMLFTVFPLIYVLFSKNF